MIGYSFSEKKYRFLLIVELIKKIVRGLFLSICKFSGNSIVAVGKHVTILGRRHDFVIGKRVKIEDGAFIQSVSVDGIRFGDNVTICQYAIIRPSGFYGGILGSGLTLGKNSSIGAFSYIGCSGKITIGDYVMIGPRCTMIAENHNFSDATEIMQKQGVTQKGIVIEDNVWIGASVTILDGVVVKSGCVIAAGAVVTKSTEQNGIYAGVPARRIKERV
ncbi:MAG: acyltransferase [Treponema sp.]|nr:acyltransferase [Treponema sp.]